MPMTKSKSGKMTAYKTMGAAKKAAKKKGAKVVAKPKKGISRAMAAKKTATRRPKKTMMGRGRKRK